MCVPCAAVMTPGLGEIILVIVAGALYSIGMCVAALRVPLLWVSALVYRFFSGAVMRKPFGESDASYLTRTGKRRGYARHVAAVARSGALVLLVMVAAFPVATAVVLTGSLISLGGALYVNRHPQLRVKVSGAVRGMITP